MTSPTGEQVAVAIDALRVDARSWNEMADQLNEAAQAAARLGLGPFSFSGLGHAIGIDDVYDELQQCIITLLNQGGANLNNVAAALRTAADGYEEDERNAVHRLRKIY